MRTDRYRTCKYQYKTVWQASWRSPYETIETYGFIAKDINPKAERAFRCLSKLEEHKKAK